MNYLNVLDYAIIAAYFVGMIFLGRLFRDNTSSKDYFLGGKSFGWFPLTFSVMATQLSAISYISAPAFVGYREGGGLTWLTYEFAAPLAMILVMVAIIPPLHRLGIVSIYEYLEVRFGISSRTLISIVFQISRSFATGVMIYAVALIAKTVTGLEIWQIVLIIGVITLVYSSMGGMKAVVYGDVIQMIVMIGGIFVSLGYALYEIGGWSTFIDHVDRSRLVAVDFEKLGVVGGDTFGFLPMVLGGFFLYASYYGTDQSQSQRLLSSRDVGVVKKTLLANGLLRFPITFMYSMMGLVLGTLLLMDISFQQEIDSMFEQSAGFVKSKTDLLVVAFIVKYLPHGIIGLLLVAILSAAMSSLSSAINSLSAVTMEDIIPKVFKSFNVKYVVYSKICSVWWGCVCLAFGFIAGGIADTVIEAINKVGSVFYGPILGMFILGIAIKRVGSISANVGLFAGVAFNVILWLFAPQIFWFWWNFIGTLVTVGIATLMSFFISEKIKKDKSIKVSFKDFLVKETYILVAFFLLIIVFSVSIPYWL